MADQSQQIGARERPASPTHPEHAIYTAYLHRSHDDDRIFADTISGLWPLLIVADGVSEIERSAGSIVGAGGYAAECAALAARTYLMQQLQGVESVAAVLETLSEAYIAAGRALIAAGRALEGADAIGGTTLLVILLWSLPDDARHYWCYAYEGNGAIAILSAARIIDGIVVPQHLLSPQQADHTACVHRGGCTVAPLVGAVRYEAGDVVYAASDGISPTTINRWLLQTRKETFSVHLLARKGHGDGWEDVLKTYDSYSDDATLGVIYT